MDVKLNCQIVLKMLAKDLIYTGNKSKGNKMAFYLCCRCSHCALYLLWKNSIDIDNTVIDISANEFLPKKL